MMAVVTEPDAATKFGAQLLAWIEQNGEDQADGDLDGSFDLDEQALDEAVIRRVEDELGYRLPKTLRAVFNIVGNGGFGPAYGLLGLEGGALQEDKRDAISMYRLFREADPEDPHWSWPAGLLPLVHLGCAMFFCVDCTTEQGLITWFEPNPHELGESWDDSILVSDVTFEELMAAWMAGKDTIQFVAESAEARRRREQG